MFNDVMFLTLHVQVGAHICRGSRRTTVAPFETLHSYIFLITRPYVTIFVYLASPKDSITSIL